MGRKLIQIVDEHDQPVGAASMDEAQTKGLWHRIVRVMVEDGQGHVLLQLRGVMATLVWSFVMSLIILKLIDLTIGLRVSKEVEIEGLDITLHGEVVQ